MNEFEILNEAFNKVKNNPQKVIENIASEHKIDIDVLIENIERNKSLISVIITSLIKKISTPNQDIRLHRTDFENGYSGRTLDTKVTIPFFKTNFSRYANKETGFLTLATREQIKWTKEEGNNLKIRNKKLKESFLNILDNVQNGIVSPKIYLEYLLTKLILLTEQETLNFNFANQQTIEINATLNINIILNMLSKHFNQKLGSRLPVIAIYSIYQILVPILKRYENKYLKSLQVHTASDKKGYGDIEIYTKDEKPFEIIEIKHNIPIDKNLIFDIDKKTQNTNINRYYILTTYANVFNCKETEQEIQNIVLEINKQRSLDIIVNGILSTLKYYLRFIDNYQEFINIYTRTLIQDAQNSAEITLAHIESWKKVLEKYKTDSK